MDLKVNRWYVRLFFWSVGVWSACLDDYRDDDGRYERNHGTNLCHFVRVIMGAFLAIVLNVLAISAAIAAAIVLPIILFGPVSYGLGAACVFGAVLIILVISKIPSYCFREESPEQARAKKRRRLEQRAAREKRGPSFLAIIWAYLVATKKKVCPMIRFTEEE